MSDLFAEQLAYYRARAREYDEWWERRGRYDRGAVLNSRWFREADEVARALERFGATGDVLELACGTGTWTRRLAGRAATLTAVDAAPEVLAINRGRVRDPRVRYVEADLFDWEPDAAYDVVFFGFWLSHVPEARFEAFWDLVRRALRPKGRFFVVDSLREPTSGAVDQDRPEPGTETATRRLNDGRTYEIYKVFREPARLAARLRSLGWSADVRGTAHHFLYGHGRVAEG